MEVRSSPSCFPLALVLFMDGCFLIGTVKAMGVLLDDILRSLDTTAADLGTALGLFNAFHFVASPFVVAIYRRMARPRILILVGAILSPVGLMLSSFATSNIMLFIFLAISGLGHAITTNCSVFLLDELAGKRFNLFYSLAVTGYSAGMVLYPLLAGALLTAYGWRAAVLILGSTMLNLVPAVMAIKMPQKREMPLDDAGSNPSAPYNRSLQMNQGKEVEENNKNAVNSDTEEVPFLGSSEEHDCPTFTLGECSGRPKHESSTMEKISKWFQRTNFYLDPYSNFILLSCGIHEFVYSGWHTFLVPHSLQRGISAHRTIIITLSAAIGNLSGRLLVAFLTHGIIDPTNMYLGSTILNITALACDAFIPNFFVMLVTSCCSAGVIAGRAVLGPLVLRNRTSPGNFPIAYCAFGVSAGCFSLLGGYATGLVADSFSTFDAAFKLLAVMDVLVFVSMLPPKLVKNPSL